MVRFCTFCHDSYTVDIFILNNESSFEKVWQLFSSLYACYPKYKSVRHIIRTIFSASAIIQSCAKIKVVSRYWWMSCWQWMYTSRGLCIYTSPAPRDTYRHCLFCTAVSHCIIWCRILYAWWFGHRICRSRLSHVWDLNVCHLQWMCVAASITVFYLSIYIYINKICLKQPLALPYDWVSCI